MRLCGLRQREDIMHWRGRQAATKRLEHRRQNRRGVAPAAMNRNVAAEQVEHVDFDTLARMGANHGNPAARTRGRDRALQQRPGGDVENHIHAIFTCLSMLELIQEQLLTIVVGEGYNNFWIRTKTDAEKISLEAGI